MSEREGGSRLWITLGLGTVLTLNQIVKKMGEFGGQNAHSTLNTDCESGV